MNADALFFFTDHLDALPLYERLEALILGEIPDLKITVSKTQISFSNKRSFAFVSFNPCRRAKERPAVWMTVSFGLGYRKETERVDVATEPYPGRWTHHVTVGSPEEIDEELKGWIHTAYSFALIK